MKSEKSILLYQFGIIFSTFGITITLLCALIAYTNENSTYKKEKLQTTANATKTLMELIKEDPNDFMNYVDFYVKNCQDMKINIDNVGYIDDYNEFINKFVEKYPGKIVNKDIMVSELPYELQLDYYEFKHEYWLSIFEDFRKNMNLEYVYFTVPDETTHYVLYVIDVERIPREGDPINMMLGDNVFNDYNKFEIEWNTWLNGNQGEFQTTNNDFGHTYTYYEPVVINRTKIGLLCSDIQVDSVNSSIVKNTVELALKILLVITLCTIILLYFIYLLYLKQIIQLTSYIKDFTDTRDVKVVETIRNLAHGKDELSQLLIQVADMITSINDYVKDLLNTHKALSEAQHEVAIAANKATKDALTGVRNKLAYDEVCKDIDYKIADGYKEFGIIMIDLNFLKRINDTYGHDKGNIAIKLLCNIICKTFSHSPVFRIGGDEFVVILENDDFKNQEEKFSEFQNKILEQSTAEGLQMWERISAAAGKAIFNPEIDQNINNVFKRADKAMYENKKNMKAIRD